MIGDISIGLLTTIAGLVFVFYAFSPRIKFGRRVCVTIQDDRKKYRTPYRNASFWDLYEVDVSVLIRYPSPDEDGVFRMLRIPVDDEEIPLLRRRRKRSPETKLRPFQLPVLQLSEFQWPEGFPLLEGMSPDDPDLKEILRHANGELWVIVGATSQFGQIRRVFRRSYKAEDIKLDGE
ncbi:MAG: hypothetical protein M3Q22_00510 [Actinomycetota bacterium]|nr:hypothetical protein [Actinomycetota bacterium]